MRSGWQEPDGIQPTYKVPALVRAPDGQVEMTGFEPATPWLQTRCSTTELHPHDDANRPEADTPEVGVPLEHSIGASERGGIWTYKRL